MSAMMHRSMWKQTKQTNQLLDYLPAEMKEDVKMCSSKYLLKLDAHAIFVAEEQDRVPVLVAADWLRNTMQSCSTR